MSEAAKKITAFIEARAQQTGVTDTYLEIWVGGEQHVLDRAVLESVVNDATNARRELGSFIALVDQATGGSGTAAPEVVLQKVRAAFAPAKDANDAWNRALKALATLATVYRDERDELQQAVTLLAATLAKHAEHEHDDDAPTELL